MCGRLSVGKGYLGVSAMLVGAAMCSTNLSSIYAEKVANALNAPDTRDEAGEIIRSLISRSC